MTDSHVAATEPQGGDAAGTGRERRRHAHLRELIEEMMASLRAAANRDLFTSEERADAEAQLSAIMARVHAEAVQIGNGRTS